MRYSKQFIWVDPSDCEPPHGLDLEPGSRDSLKVESLEVAFRGNGFDLKEPCLIGYPHEGKIQLLSGTHRHEAASRSGIKLPVRIVLRSVVEAKWGTQDWESLIEDIPVEKLQFAEVKESDWFPGIGERINLQEAYEKEEEQKED